MVSEAELEITVVSFSGKVDFFGIGLCLHFESLDGRHSGCELDVPVDAFEFHGFQFFVDDFCCHESVVVFEVTSGVLKVDAVGHAGIFSGETELCVLSILLQVQQDLELAEIGHAKRAHEVCMWLCECAFHYHVAIFGQAVDHCGLVVAGDLDQVNNSQVMCVFY